MPTRSPVARVTRVVAAVALVGAVALPGATTVMATSYNAASGNAKLDHVFVIMLENHSAENVIGNPAAPNITRLAHDYGNATRYYGVTHPSLPNYVAAISGSNWGAQTDNPTQTFTQPNLVDQLESHGISWGAYMESMPSAGFTGTQYPASAALYANKHNPFVLFTDILSSPSRLAKVKPYTDFASDMASGNIPAFVWITPNQCNDLHGGIYVTIDPASGDGTPCPYGTTTPTQDAKDLYLIRNADNWVQRAVDTIRKSKAWSQNSAIFVVTDENDFVFGNTATDRWESAAWCCDSPILPDGFVFSDGLVWHGQPGPDGTTDYHYGGGIVPAIVIAKHGPRHYTSDVAYNHYSLLRTIEENWNLPYLANASDGANVRSMAEFLAH